VPLTCGYSLLIASERDPSRTDADNHVRTKPRASQNFDEATLSDLADVSTARPATPSGQSTKGQVAVMSTMAQQLHWCKVMLKLPGLFPSNRRGTMNQVQFRRIVDRVLRAALPMAYLLGEHLACNTTDPKVNCAPTQRVFLTPLLRDGGVVGSDGGLPADGGQPDGGTGSDLGEDLTQQCNCACLLQAGTAHQVLYQAKLVTDDPSGKPACDCFYGSAANFSKCVIP